MCSPDPRQSSPHSGRKSTYPAVQILPATSDSRQNNQLDTSIYRSLNVFFAGGGEVSVRTALERPIVASCADVRLGFSGFGRYAGAALLSSQSVRLML
jgi:hypothetical protein